MQRDSLTKAADAAQKFDPFSFGCYTFVGSESILHEVVKSVYSIHLGRLRA